MLQSCTAKNTKSFEDYIPRGEIDAKVLSVYDGDTIWVAYINPTLGVPIRAKVRFTRIDAPEIRGKKGESAADKKARLLAANRSKDVLAYIVQDRIVRLNIVDIDKFGRMLADVLVPETDWLRNGLLGDVESRESGRYVDLSSFMLKGGYAATY